MFAIPCKKLTITNGIISINNKKIHLKNSYLYNIHHLTIKCEFAKRRKFLKNVKKFVTFLSTNFPKFETFNADFAVPKYADWKWNDERMANLFKSLPSGVKGSITYTIRKYVCEIDRNQYPGVQLNGNEYSIVFTITENFSLKLITTFLH